MKKIVNLINKINFFLMNKCLFKKTQKIVIKSKKDCILGKTILNKKKFKKEEKMYYLK